MLQYNLPRDSKGVGIVAGNRDIAPLNFDIDNKISAPEEDSVPRTEEAVAAEYDSAQRSAEIIDSIAEAEKAKKSLEQIGGLTLALRDLEAIGVQALLDQFSVAAVSQALLSSKNLYEALCLLEPESKNAREALLGQMLDCSRTPVIEQMKKEEENTGPAEPRNSGYALERYSRAKGIIEQTRKCDTSFTHRRKYGDKETWELQMLQNTRVTEQQLAQLFSGVYPSLGEVTAELHSQASEAAHKYQAEVDRIAADVEAYLSEFESKAQAEREEIYEDAKEEIRQVRDILAKSKSFNQELVNSSLDRLRLAASNRWNSLSRESEYRSEYYQERVGVLKASNYYKSPDSLTNCQKTFSLDEE